MKKYILGTLSAITFLLAVISSFAVYVSGAVFLILLCAKIFDVQGIEWFSFTHFSVIMTPIYMIIGGLISTIINYILTGLFITAMKKQ